MRRCAAEPTQHRRIAGDTIGYLRTGSGKEIDFAPVPGAGAEAMLKGAPLVFVVGESLVSQWTLVTAKGDRALEDADVKA